MSRLKGLPDILRVLGQKHPGLRARLTEIDAMSRWTAAVGPKIAKHSRAYCVKNGVLWVEVDHPIWRAELHLRKDQILKILNGAGDGEAVLKDLYFVEPRPMETRNGVLAPAPPKRRWVRTRKPLAPHLPLPRNPKPGEVKE